MARRHLVPDGLTVRGNQVSSNIGAPERERGGAGEGFTEQDIDLADLVDATLLRTEQGVNPLAQTLIDAGFGVAEQLDRQLIRLLGYVDHSRVDAVD